MCNFLFDPSALASWEAPEGSDVEYPDSKDFIKDLPGQNDFREESYNSKPGGSKHHESGQNVEVATEWIISVQRIQDVPDEGYRRKEVPDIQSTSSDSRKSCKYILKAVKHLDTLGRHNKTSLKVLSPYICAALRTALGEATYELLRDPDDIQALSIDEPYIELYHNRGHIIPPDNLEGREHVESLLKFLELENPEACSKLREMHEETIASIDGNIQWLLYKPGTTVYHKSRRDWLAFKVDGVTGGHGRGADKQPLTLKLRSIECSKDRHLQWRYHTRIAPDFVGSMPLQDLSYIPERYLLDQPEVRRELVVRGRRYQSFLRSPKFLQYTGGAWSETGDEETLRVIVDTKIPLEPDDSEDEEDGYSSQACRCATHTGSRRDKRQAPQLKTAAQQVVGNEAEKLQLEHNGLVFCPARVNACPLRLKSYAEVRLDELTEIKFDPQALDKLVISDHNKRLVTELTSEHTTEEGKTGEPGIKPGRGLVILLHGSPGTGKTCVAECVAENMKKPIYTITGGELGFEPGKVKYNLREAFAEARRWDAIVLISKADIFLSKRNVENIQQNALATVFLSEMEEFKGILVLTTSIVNTFDETFRSRVHLAFHMPRLDLKAQLRVWANLLYGSDQQLSKLSDDKSKFLAYIVETTKDDKLNGREIGNYIATARALSKKQGEDEISKRAISTVLDTMRKFSEYTNPVQKRWGEDTLEELFY